MARSMVTSVPAGRSGVKGSDFAPLLREIKAAGLLERRTSAYVVAIGVNLALMAATWAGMVVLASSWWVLLLAVPMGILSTRAAFFAHDAGHQQIASSRKLHDWIGRAHGGLLLGMSYDWWNDKHNRHHANPNHVDKDPDVGGSLAFTPERARGRTGLIGWLTCYQGRLFFLLLTVEGFHLKYWAFRFLLARPRRESRLEFGLIALHLVLYFGALFLVLSPGKAVLFALIHHMVLGVHLGSVFAPNHKGMEMHHGEAQWGYIEKQVLTSRNVDGGPITDWMMGGLNYQIEHHLFPSMPRSNLRHAQPIVAEYCSRIGISYLSTGLIESYRIGLRHLHEASSELRAHRALVRHQS
ncbi:fatty acid desaturase family protein [Mycobacterium szulgai]|uniref:Delta-6 fatty acid desaturase n=1 Tax=Mycobacterium szulgai TaxID=1787 RepID=A0A1X2EXU8_MYCSZ|nr:acyl-CoA desaturase [Mycobacterium szulgai]MCV7078925.1 acyl-CoA desaturase [Mycobacterium szulgai]ORX10956.1 delta-6 fatty acid desaturase [Mycobacterium szulgai]